MEISDYTPGPLEPEVHRTEVHVQRELLGCIAYAHPKKQSISFMQSLTRLHFLSKFFTTLSLLSQRTTKAECKF